MDSEDKQRVSLYLDRETVKTADLFMKKHGYRSRNEFFVTAARNLIADSMIKTGDDVLSNIMAGLGRSDARFHDLRHTYAVMSLQEGDDPKTVQENLGHATASFTLDVYGHVSEKMKQDSAARMQKYITKIRA